MQKRFQPYFLFGFIGLVVAAFLWWTNNPPPMAEFHGLEQAAVNSAPAPWERETSDPADQGTSDRAASAAVDAASTALQYPFVLSAKRSVSTDDQSNESRVSHSVRNLLAALKERKITPDNFLRSGFQVTNPFLRIDREARVQLYVHLFTVGYEQLTSLRQLGFEIELENTELQIIQGWVTFDRIRDIAALSFVRNVAPPSYGISRRGSETTEGDAILRADLLRQMGFDGSGVKIGIISDGANDLADAQSSNDLPSNVTVYGNCTTRSAIAPLCEPGWTCNEGTAMAEIIHDIAPGAELAIGAVDTSLEFISRIDQLVNEFGADIIVDDLGFLTEPFFSDGPVAQAVANVADDIVYISAAGDTPQHYETDYFPGDFLLLDTPVNLHDFGKAAGGALDGSLNLEIGPGSYLLGVLQWNDQFGSSGNDYDLLLGNIAETELLCAGCFSGAFQEGVGNPFESVCYHNNSNETQLGKIAIYRFAGNDVRVEMHFRGNDITIEYPIPEGSIFGHAAVSDVLAVGAINADEPGNDELASYSSQGPSRIDFPSLQVRPKPDLVAIDGVSVTGTGGFPSTFFGTSAAAAHVAGIAALLTEAALEATPTDIRNALKSGAVDLGAPGDDDLYGTGRVDAMASITFLDVDIDTDGDGIGDNADPDDDNDGMPDSFEVANGLDPLDASDADQDADGDGATNLQEYQTGTNPQSAASVDACFSNSSVAPLPSDSSLAIEKRLFVANPGSNNTQQTFLRFINPNDSSAAIELYGIDDGGNRSKKVTSFALASQASKQLSAQDIENGNTGKGLIGNLCNGQGKWQLFIRSDNPIEVLGLIRTPDGFLTSLNDRVPKSGNDNLVYFANPASNSNQQTFLRVVNLTENTGTVTITGIDDAGITSAGTITFTLGPNQSKQINAQDLENGNVSKGLTGNLDNGSGKWRLTLSSTLDLEVMSLIRTPDGFLTNLSGMVDENGSGEFIIYFGNPASDTTRQTFLRIINISNQTGTVTITGIDDAGQIAPGGDVMFELGPNESKQMNAQDLESGNFDKGMLGMLGDGDGRWRLTVSADIDIRVMSLIRTPDGFLTNLSRVTPVTGNVNDVFFFNPASNLNQVSSLRIVNDSDQQASVTISGIDDNGNAGPGGEVIFNVPANSAMAVTAQDLENGNGPLGLVGTLGNGTGKWRLKVTSNADLKVQGLMNTPSGFLTNISRTSE